MSRKAFGNKENKNKENCRDNKETKIIKKARQTTFPQNMSFQWLQVSSDEHENLKYPERGTHWALQDKFKEYQIYGVTIDPNICYAQSLQRHQITPEKRQAFLLWMGRTLSVTKICSYQTYFLVMSYFDNFLKLSEKQFLNSQVHMIGLACIGIASKITDINSLQFAQIQMMGKISNQVYKEIEILLIRTLQNNLITPTYFEYFDLIGRMLYFKYIDKAAKFTVIFYKGLRLLMFVTQYYDVTHYPLASVAYYCYEITLKGLEKEYDVADLLEELQFVRFNCQITQPVDMIIDVNTLIAKGLSDEQEKQFHAIYFAY